MKVNIAFSKAKTKLLTKLHADIKKAHCRSENDLNKYIITRRYICNV
jgi:hypothetical protein